MDVYTAKGVVDISELTVKDVVMQEDNARVTATEWYMGDELVRRDVHVNILCGQALNGEQAAL